MTLFKCSSMCQKTLNRTLFYPHIPACFFKKKNTNLNTVPIKNPQALEYVNKQLFEYAKRKINKIKKSLINTGLYFFFTKFAKIL